MIWPICPSAAAKPKRALVGKLLAEVRGAGVVQIVAEGGRAQRAREGGEQVRRGVP